MLYNNSAGGGAAAAVPLLTVVVVVDYAPSPFNARLQNQFGMGASTGKGIFLSLSLYFSLSQLVGRRRQHFLTL